MNKLWANIFCEAYHRATFRNIFKKQLFHGRLKCERIVWNFLCLVKIMQIWTFLTWITFLDQIWQVCRFLYFCSYNIEIYVERNSMNLWIDKIISSLWLLLSYYCYHQIVSSFEISTRTWHCQRTHTASISTKTSWKGLNF